MVWLTVASAALLRALNLWHCAECLAIRPSPNPSAMNNFHGRCTLITFPFKWHCGGLSRSLISVRILLQAFYCCANEAPQIPQNLLCLTDCRLPAATAPVFPSELATITEVRETDREKEREIYICLSAWARRWEGSLPTTLKGPVGLKVSRTFSNKWNQLQLAVRRFARWTILKGTYYNTNLQQHYVNVGLWKLF